MRQGLHAEWTKWRTAPATGWLLFAIVTVTVAVGAVVSAAVTCRYPGCGYDATKLSLTGVQVAQAIVAMLAVLAISGEYSTGMMRTTLTAMPRRTMVFATKAAVVTGVTLAVGAAGVLASVFAGRLLLPGSGFTPVNGYPPMSVTDGPMLRAAVGSVLYLVLIALFSIGMAAIVRDSAAAIGTVLGLVYLLPVVVLLMPDPDWQRLLWQISPTNAGLAIQDTTDLASLPLQPWEGLGVLAAWATAAFLGGGVILRLRDA